MKKRHLILGLVQLFLIFASGWHRRASWREIDFISDAPSSGMQLSLYCLAGWLLTIVIAAWFAMADKMNRSMIVLFLVVLLPSMEFFLWFALSY
ncbi:hypothetical protein LIG30_3318 [Burkholderia sp. lig30]|jgi:hypothetical protein|uniref:hypothetical protein n=1 Tax=Burkholderia sp. lig30 TaxID=1192124 RepID=UPI000461A79E|nr:hypothetical protein [Burkholderia sp. lig30]KDB07409.1 hypothetical protein LIG30_3318 [Burkholderia sp. lig30]